MPTNPDIEFFARTDREVTPSNPDIDTSSQRPKDATNVQEAQGRGQWGVANAYRRRQLQDGQWERPTRVGLGWGRQLTAQG